MSDRATPIEAPDAYNYSSHVTLECPKCGRRGSFPFSRRQKGTVEYAGVCGAMGAAGWWCGTVLSVRVTTHARGQHLSRRWKDTGLNAIPAIAQHDVYTTK